MSADSDPHALFVEHARRHPECLDPAAFAMLREENPLPGWELELWPLAVTPEKARRLGALAVDLAALVRSVPERVFGDDLEALARYFELPGGEAMAELVLGEPNGVERALYRGDFLETADGFRLLEMNAGSGMTGWNLSPLAALYPRVPAIARFLEAHGLALETPDALRATLAHFVAGVLATPGLADDGAVHVAIPVSIYEDNIYNQAAEEQMGAVYEEVLAAADPALAGSVRFCDYADLEVDRGRVVLGGRRIHAVFEQQVPQGAARRRIVGAFKAGGVDLYTGPASQVVMDKRVLVLLSEGAAAGDGGGFDAAERAALDAVPWTRRVAREEVDWGGATVHLPELLLRERAGLVLKKAFSHSGKHVVLGRATDEAEWRVRVEAALAAEGGGWVVQEALESVPYTLLDDPRGPLPHDVVWGLLSFGGGFHGGYLRTLPTERRAVINQFHGARSSPFLVAVPR